MGSLNKYKKSIKQNVSDMAGGIYEAIKRNINGRPLSHRARIAWRILRGKW